MVAEKQYPGARRKFRVKGLVSGVWNLERRKQNKITIESRIQKM